MSIEAGNQSIAAFSDALSELAASARALYPEFDLARPGGVLRLAGPAEPVDRIRVELPAGQVLALQSLGIDIPDVEAVAAIASVESSSWAYGYTERFDAVRLFAFDYPSGTTVRTLVGDVDDAPHWVEVRLQHAVQVRSVSLRNTAEPENRDVHGLRVLAGTGAELEVLYSADALQGAALAVLQRMDAARRGGDEEVAPFLPLLSQVIAADYRTARQEFKRLGAGSDALRRAFKRVINDQVLVDRSLEWTGHGAQRCFRFWSVEEKRRYLRAAGSLMSDLHGLTDSVCFGFGAALAVVRDHDLIPHDDDLDLIIAFEPEVAPSLLEANELVERHLGRLGYTVLGDHVSHRRVAKPGEKSIDVFVAIYEGDVIAWYPGRRGSLTRQMMFPVTPAEILGETVAIPHHAVAYLEQVYGPRWQVPDSDFRHTWDRASYRDQLRRRPGRRHRTSNPDGIGADQRSPGRIR